MNDFKKGNFVNDAEKMRDFHRLTKEEFLQSYSYLTEEEYDNTYKLVIPHTKYRVCIKYIVHDYVDVELPSDQNPNDAIELAEEISWYRPAGDMDWELDSSTIIARE